MFITVSDYQLQLFFMILVIYHRQKLGFFCLLVTLPYCYYSQVIPFFWYIEWGWAASLLLMVNSSNSIFIDLRRITSKVLYEKKIFILEPRWSLRWLLYSIFLHDAADADAWCCWYLLCAEKNYANIFFNVRVADWLSKGVSWLVDVPTV